MRMAFQHRGRRKSLQALGAALTALCLLIGAFHHHDLPGPLSTQLRLQDQRDGAAAPAGPCTACRAAQQKVSAAESAVGVLLPESAVLGLATALTTLPRKSALSPVASRAPPVSIPSSS